MSKKTKTAPTADKQAVIEANEFVLKDASGGDRAVLGTDAEGLPGLRLFDANGRSRLHVFLSDGDNPALAMFDSEVKNNVALAIRDDTRAEFWLRGWNTGFKVSLDHEFGISSVRFGGEGRSTIGLTLDNGNDHVGVSLTDSEGNALADVSYNPDNGHDLRIESAFGDVELTESGFTVTGKDGFIWSSPSTRPLTTAASSGAQPAPDPETVEKVVGSYEPTADYRVDEPFFYKLYVEAELKDAAAAGTVETILAEYDCTVTFSVRRLHDGKIILRGVPQQHGVAETLDIDWPRAVKQARIDIPMPDPEVAISAIYARYGDREFGELLRRLAPFFAMRGVIQAVSGGGGHPIRAQEWVVEPDRPKVTVTAFKHSATFADDGGDDSQNGK